MDFVQKRESVWVCHGRVKMITGDQLLIGKEVAKQLGMGNDFYTTEALLHDVSSCDPVLCCCRGLASLYAALCELLRPCAVCDLFQRSDVCGAVPNRVLLLRVGPR